MNNLHSYPKRTGPPIYVITTLIVAIISGGLSAQVAPAAPSVASQQQPQPPSDPAFYETWSRTDLPVQLLQVKRSYYWGGSLRQPFYERYDEGPGGKHLVAYYDKARMEINDPNGNRSNPFFVTNGQLSKELITGRVQVGNNNFVQLAPAEVDIASDTDDTSSGTPTYASFRNLIRTNPMQIGGSLSATINRAGQEGNDPTLLTKYRVFYAYYEPATQNNIPDVFLNFLNSSGPVIVRGQNSYGRLSSPYFYATGYPISAAYWAKVKIAGKPNTDVLIQVYERRVLTYVPSAPDGWRVQMGNVGQHYFEWRYRNVSNAPVYFSCNAPGGKTGQLWFAHPEVQQAVGCADDGLPEKGITVAHQKFERGEMLDLITTTGLKTIYVLFDDGTARKYDDLYKDGDPEPRPGPPPGLYAPTAGFGKIWREANLLERIGWATAPETVTTYDAKSEPPLPTPVPTALPGRPTPGPIPPAPTVIPASNRGFPAIRDYRNSVGPNFILYAGPTLGKFYVVYGQGNRWMAYNDTAR